MTIEQLKKMIIAGLLIGMVLGMIVAACMIGREIPGPFFAYTYVYTFKDFLLSCAGGIAAAVVMGYSALKGIDRMS